MNNLTFIGTVQNFPCVFGGWVYVAIPNKYIEEIKERRRAWGMLPITALVGKISWITKLMMKKSGDLIVALRADVRKNESIAAGDTLIISIKCNS